MNKKGSFLLILPLFLIFTVPASANLKKDIKLLSQIRSEIHLMEENLAEKTFLAKEKDLPLVEDLSKIRQQIKTLKEKLNLRLDEQESIKKRMRREALQRRLNLLEYKLGIEKVKNIEKELSFLQSGYMQALSMPGISYDDVEFSQYIGRKGKKKLSEADIIPYFGKKLIKKFTQNGVGTVFFLPIKNPIDYYRWPPEKFIPWAKDIPPFVSSTYKQASLLESIASTLKEKSLELQGKGYSTIAVVLHFNADGSTLFFLPRKIYDPKAGKLHPNLNKLEFLYSPPDNFLAKIRKDTVSSLNRALSKLKGEQEELTTKQRAQHLSRVIDNLDKTLNSLRGRFSSIYYKLRGSPFGMYNIKKKLGGKYEESWEDLGAGLNPRRVNIYDTSVAARYGIQAYLLEVDNLKDTSPFRMEKIAKRLVENYKQVIMKIAREKGESFEKVKNTTCLLFIPGENPTSPNQAFTEFTHYKKLFKKIKDREKNDPKLEKLCRKIKEYEEIQEAKLELKKLNLERESLVYMKEDNLKIKQKIDRLAYALKLNEEILELKERIAKGKDDIKKEKLFVYHRYNIDSPYLPLGIVSYKAGKPLSGILFTSLEGYLFYSGIDEKDGNKIGLGCILTLLEFLYNRKVASEYNQDLSQKLGLTLGKDKVSISMNLKF